MGRRQQAAAVADAPGEPSVDAVMALRREMAERLRLVARDEFAEENVIDWAVQRALICVAEAFEVGVRHGA
jgi:hypothetical protein